MATAAFTAELIVEREFRGKRIDTFLAAHFRNHTKWRLHRMVCAGLVTINDAPAEPSDRVHPGQRVTIRLVEPPDKLVAADPVELPVIYEDPWMIVIDKPAGLAAHPAGSLYPQTVSTALQHHFDRQTPLRGLLRAGIVHRLDRDTSGVMVVAKNHLAHRRLGRQFEKGRVRKTYVAIVVASPQTNEATIDVPIGWPPMGPRRRMWAGAEAVEARPATTQVEVVERFGPASLVRARPLTGRPHQIRVHLAHLGHPIVCDPVYGPATDGRCSADASGSREGVPVTDAGRDAGAREAIGRESPENARADLDDGNETQEPSRAVQCDPDAARRCERLLGGVLSRQALHAQRLVVEHPVGGQPMTFETALPEDMRQAIDALRRQATDAKLRG